MIGLSDVTNVLSGAVSVVFLLAVGCETILYRFLSMSLFFSCICFS